MCSLTRGLLVFVNVFYSVAALDEVLVFGQEGKSVTFPNNAKNAKGTWTFENKEVISNTKPILTTGNSWKGRATLISTNLSLTINNLQRSDFGLYTCHIPYVDTLKSYRLYRTTVSLQGNKVLLVSQKMVLELQVFPSAPRDVTYNWFSPKNDALQETSNKLTLAQVNMENDGVWTCAVIHNNVRSTITTKVDVVELQGPPSQIFYQNTSKTSSINLTCKLSADHSLKTLKLKEATWTFESSISSSRQIKLFTISEETAWNLSTHNKQQAMGFTQLKHPILSDLSLYKKPVRVEDAGKYICSLDFPERVTLSRTVEVEVLQASYTGGIEGQTLTLTCSLGHRLSPELNVQWKPPKTSSVAQQSSNLTREILTITQAGMQERGNWKCELWKGLSLLVSTDINVKMEKAPVDVKLLASICGSVVGFLLVVFLTLILVRRHKQQRATFRRRRRKTKYCQCKHSQQNGIYKI